jgi:hypothetical protein
VSCNTSSGTGADGQRGLLQPLARLGAERVGTGQPPTVAEQRQETVVVGVGARVYVAVVRTSDTWVVALKRPSAPPIAAA